jgi:hypothetical protein
MPMLNLEPTYGSVLPTFERLTVVLVGVGGTGSALATADGGTYYRCSAAATGLHRRR